MAVLINGIEMPKGADEHRLIIRANGQVIIDKKAYWEEAKAVPVPPHGRLIDADAIIKDMEEALWDWETVDGIAASAVLKQTITDLRNAPTIIPAEECE